jgi:CheY-like chemotaxis protein
MKKIMIVDDEPDLIFSIKCALENFSEEYKVIGA